MTGFAEHYPDRERFRELMEEVGMVSGYAPSGMSGLLMQIEQVISRGLYGRVSTRDLPPVDHRMLGRSEPVVPRREFDDVTLTVQKPASVGKTEKPWYPPPLTSADLYADWQYRCAQHAKQRY